LAAIGYDVPTEGMHTSVAPSDMGAYALLCSVSVPYVSTPMASGLALRNDTSFVMSIHVGEVNVALPMSLYTIGAD
jgi:hypothetical protein